ncbi:MAG: Dabb family protein [bacterium]
MRHKILALTHPSLHYLFYPLLVCCLIGSLSACQSTSTLTKADKPLHHIVMVWFNDQVSDAEKKTIQQATLSLKDIPVLLSLELGTAIPSNRAIVDDSFDLGIVMTFRDQSAMQTYLKHPKHKAFLKQYIQGKTDKIVVYDF